MNSLRKVVGILLAMTFAVFALPSYGQATQKLLSISMEVVEPNPHPEFGTQLKATIKNVSPVGNAQFSWADISVVNVPWTLNPAGPVEITESDNSSPGGTAVVFERHVTVSGIFPVKPDASLFVTFYVYSSACGDGKWTVRATTGSQGTGDVFGFASESLNQRSTLISCEQLACDTFVDVQYGTPIRVTRGPNWDGTACLPTDVYMTDTLATNLVPPVPGSELSGHIAYGHWNVDNALSGALSYRFPGNLTNPKVAWTDKLGVPFIAGGDTNDPEFHYVNANPALICNPPNNIDFFGRPYGRTVGFVSPTATKFQINPTVPGAVQRPATLPVYAMLNGEVVQITKWVIATNTVTVVRARATTTADPPEGAPLGTALMYTPFGVTTVASPNLPVNIQVKMCVTPDSPYNGSGFGGPGDWTHHDKGDGYFGGD